MTYGHPAQLPAAPPTATVRLTRGDELATTVVNVEEIVRGLRDAETRTAQDLVAGLVVLPITLAAAWQAGTWRREHAERGSSCGRPTASSPRPLRSTAQR